MKRYLSLIVCLLFLSVSAKAQFSKVEYYNDIDNKVFAYSKKPGQTIDSVIRYVNETFVKKEDKIRAYYTWIVFNIKYDDNQLVSYELSKYEQLVALAQIQNADTVFKSRLAGCRGLSDLMVKLCLGSGIKCKTIIGYSKTPEGKIVTKTLHCWNIVKSDSAFRLLDIMWYNGYIDEKDQYIKRSSGKYFLISPKVFINDHYPVDPRWQLIDHPVSFDSFKKDTILLGKKLYHYSDSIVAYFMLSLEDQDLLDHRFLYSSDLTDTSLAHDLDVKINNAALKQITHGKSKYDEYAKFNNNTLRMETTVPRIKEARDKLNDSKKGYVKASSILKGQKGNSVYYKFEFEKMNMHIDMCLMEIEEQFVRLDKMEKSLKKKS